MPAAFLCIVFLSLLLLYFGTGRNSRVLVIYGIWGVLAGVLSYLGFYSRAGNFPFSMLMIMLPVILLTVYFYRTIPRETLNARYLLAVHIVRIPVEIILFQLYLQKLVPVQMTFKGWNFDIVIGITALLLVFSKNLPPLFFKIWNIVGLCFLATIVIIAVLAGPTPIQQIAFEQPNVAILTFPYTLLPTIIVPAVLLSHLLYLKQPVSGKDRNSY